MAAEIALKTTAADSEQKKKSIISCHYRLLLVHLVVFHMLMHLQRCNVEVAC
jgi:hypothetical protein